LRAVPCNGRSHPYSGSCQLGNCPSRWWGFMKRGFGYLSTRSPGCTCCSSVSDAGQWRDGLSIPNPAVRVAHTGFLLLCCRLALSAAVGRVDKTCYVRKVEMVSPFLLLLHAGLDARFSSHAPMNCCGPTPPGMMLCVGVLLFIKGLRRARLAVFCLSRWERGGGAASCSVAIVHLLP
jgi:hypothetical protein